jgi:ADP-L-glycero-D-manno-heptose 6-epimerase
MILVTGGAGFIGSNIAVAFERAGADVAICDTFGQDGKWRNLEALSPAAIVAPDNVLEWLDANADKVEAVVHMGAISSTTERDVDLIVRTNVLFSQGIWSWCATHARPLLYASSAATYGDGAQGFADDDALPYLQGLRPLNAYGWSKNLFDKWCVKQVAAGRPAPPHWYGLKFFNVYGPGEHHKAGMQSVVTQIAPRIQAGEIVRLFRSHHPDYRDGEQLRDFVYVADCVKIMQWLLAAKPPNGLYNAGTGRARTFLDLARGVFAALKRPERIEFIDTPVSIRDKYQYFTQARMSKLTGAGYPHAFTALEDGIKDHLGG